MNIPQKLLQLLLVSLGLAWLGTACVRLNEPDKFFCHNDADCDGSERCSYELRCIPKDYCDAETYCPDQQHCANQHCISNGCSVATQAADCHGFQCTGGVCDTTCFSNCAQGFHCDTSLAICVPGALLSNGDPCSNDLQCSPRHCCSRPNGQPGSICLDACKAVTGSSCTAGVECASGYCCKDSSGKLACSASACAAPPECTSDAGCGAGMKCQNQKCVAMPVLQPAGGPCQADADCAGHSCVDKVCRGKQMTNEGCTIDAECAPGRLCCTNLYSRSIKSCGELSRGCAGSIGDKCEVDLDCLDNQCDEYQCTKTCTKNSDCGTSSWGAPNACDDSVFGRICFPGCSNDEDCAIHVPGTFCDSTSDFSAMACF